MQRHQAAPTRALLEVSSRAALLVVGSRGRPVAVVRGTEPPDEGTDPTRRVDHPGTSRTGDGHREELATVTVGTQRLPGFGWRYTVPADRGRQLLIVVEGTGDRHLVLVDPTLDNPLATIRSNATTSSIIAALLAGARFHTEPPDQ